MVITVTLALLAGATAALWPQTAGAAGYNPVPNTSWGTNGENRAAVLHGGTLYVGGAFAAAVQGASTLARADLVAIDTATGNPVLGFVADTNGSVEALATDGSWLYVGGTFTTIKAVSRTNLARVSLNDGSRRSRLRSGAQQHGVRPVGARRPPVRGRRLHLDQRPDRASGWRPSTF